MLGKQLSAAQTRASGVAVDLSHLFQSPATSTVALKGARHSNSTAKGPAAEANVELEDICQRQNL